MEGGIKAKEKMAERITATNKKPEKRKIMKKGAEKRI